MKYGRLLKIVIGLCCVAAGLMFVIARQRLTSEAVIISQGYTDVTEASDGTETESLTQTAASTTASDMLIVHVCGAVVSPGVYEVPEGSRIWNCIQAAGGFSEEASQTSLNLAEPVTDGEKIYVPTAEEQAMEQSEAAEKSAGLININTATVEELMTLPGIGQARAEAIIAYRTGHGDFAEPSDIMNVSGIKEAAYEKIKDKIKTG